MLAKANYPCFETDIYNITSKLNIDFISMVVSRKSPMIQCPLDPIEVNVHHELMQYLNSWYEKESRTKFAEILEEHVRNN